MQTYSYSFVQKYTITDCQTLCLWCGVCMRADRRVSMCMCVYVLAQIVQKQLYTNDNKIRHLLIIGLY